MFLFYLSYFYLQVREQLHQSLRQYHRYDLRQRNEIREIRAIYKKATHVERSYFYRERALALNYPDDNLSMMIDGAAQE